MDFEVGEHGLAGRVLNTIVVGNQVDVAFATDGQPFDLLLDPAVGGAQVGEQITDTPLRNTGGTIPDSRVIPTTAT